MELAYYPWFVFGHLVAARFNIYLWGSETVRLYVGVGKLAPWNNRLEMEDFTSNNQFTVTTEFLAAL
jgi:hypothetical protein